MIFLQAVASKLLNSHSGSTIFHHMSKIICIAPRSSTLSQRVRGIEVFLRFGFLNVALVHESPSGDIIYEIVTSVLNKGRSLKNPKDSSLVFPDKLKNVEGFKYKVPIYYQPPVVDVIDNQMISPMLFFLDAIGTAQNAKFDVIFLRNSSDFASYWLSRQMHLTLNTAREMKNPDVKVQTYDKKSYCALVPIPPIASVFSVIFVKPFDALIWMLFILSIVSSVAVWRLFRGRGAVDSHWKLAVGIFTMFIGQGAEFSRKNRFVLAVLLNIICLSVFLLSNLYEGAITSFMIEPAKETRLKTVADLLNSNYEFQSGQLFEDSLRNSSLVRAMSSRLNASGLQMGAEDGRYIIDQQYVFIRTCDYAKVTLSEKITDGRHVSDYYFLLPEELSWQFVQLEASFSNPFVERFQYFMDLSFQAGLPHMWKVFVSQDRQEFFNVYAQDERDYLELQDLGSVFGVLLIGLLLSALVLLIEIFYYDCVKSLDLRGKVRKLWIRMRNVLQRKNKVENPKVRRINVRPMRRI